MNPSLFTNYSGPLFALASAALFGASSPVAKLLLGVTDPLLLAGLLYLGSGIGLGITGLSARLSGRAAEAPLRRHDLAWLGLIALFGAILGPASPDDRTKVRLEWRRFASSQHREPRHHSDLLDLLT